MRAKTKTHMIFSGRAFFSVRLASKVDKASKVYKRITVFLREETKWKKIH